MLVRCELTTITELQPGRRVPTRVGYCARCPRCERTEAVKVGPYDGALTEVTGSAHVMGHNHFVLEQDDPFPAGFFLR